MVVRPWYGLLLVLAVGCVDEHQPAGHPVAPAPAPARPPSEPQTPEIGLWSGEELRAEVTLRGVPVGEYHFAVAAPCRRDGRAILPIRSRAERSGIVAALTDSGASVTSWLDAQTGRPIEARAVIESRLSTKYFEVWFQTDSYRYIYHRHNKNNPRKYRYEQERLLPPHVPVHDIHSGLGLMRRWAGEIGKRGTFYAVVGKTLWRLDASVERREEVDAGGRTYAAVRIDGTARRLTKDLEPSKRVNGWSLWISDEAARLPLKSQLKTRDGVVEADLLSYAQHPIDAALAACPDHP